MTKINSQDVRKVANLARLALEEDELNTYAMQIQEILGYIEQLKKVNTSDVKPTTRAVEVVNKFRKDFVDSENIKEELLDLAPQRDGDFIRVPKILSE
tara:strand:- start:165 stop:458 length:294 start_codon:yes stop_codon:yes gene_type:complete